jgi:hypothetical protein
MGGSGRWTGTEAGRQPRSRQSGAACCCLPVAPRLQMLPQPLQVIAAVRKSNTTATAISTKADGIQHSTYTHSQTHSMALPNAPRQLHKTASAPPFAPGGGAIDGDAAGGDSWCLVIHCQQVIVPQQAVPPPHPRLQQRQLSLLQQGHKFVPVLAQLGAAQRRRLLGQ